MTNKDTMREALEHIRDDNWPDAELNAAEYAALVLAALDAPQAVAQGWKLVPEEPTDEMVEAAWESDGTDYVGEHKRIWRFDLAYKAALSAAPSTPQPAEGEKK